MASTLPQLRLGAAFLLACAGSVGCAFEGERRARAAWDVAWAGLRPAEHPPAPITSASGLADYLAVARARSPRLRAQAQRWRAGIERVPQARTLPDPRVSYGGFVEPIQTRVGPQEHRFGVTQRIPWPGKLHHRAGMALAEAAVQGARTEVVRRDVSRAVARAYADYWVLGREVAITEDTLALLEHWEAVARARLRAGTPGAHGDAIKAQVEIGRLEDRLASLRDAREPRVERLRELLDLPADAALPWPTRLPAWELPVPERELRARLLGQSPVLAARERAVDARERGVGLAWQSYLPDLRLGAEYLVVGDAVSPNVRGSGDDAFLLGVGLDLPVWFGAYEAGVDEAEARLRAAELDREATRDALESELARALFAFRDAERRRRLYRGSLLPKAEQSLQATAGAYEAGEGDFLDVLDAERTLLEFQLSLERARAERLRALADLYDLIGADLGPARESRQ